ncbi:hypothetical protein V6Z11_A04G077100 [Gossypium hirsutum]|uniref:Uncharacterized protein n=2 Tax=Gossypium TaxID=3633 RepID=A0A5D2QZP2_GOSTO|nr:hypothetical protein ES288_A04G077600v1 [Gossypium darwinii]TYI32694.1 hypothetical protein ES332_A04G080800v1 [Gossypium tomentosum]
MKRKCFSPKSEIFTPSKGCQMFANVFLMAGKLTTLAVKKHPTKTSTGIERASYSPSSKLRLAKPLSIPNPHPIKKTNYLIDTKISAKETQIQKKTKGLNERIKNRAYQTADKSNIISYTHIQSG